MKNWFSFQTSKSGRKMASWKTETWTTMIKTDSFDIDRGISAPVRLKHRIKCVLESCILIWLHFSINECSSDFQNGLRKFKTIIHQVETFGNVDECFNYVNLVKDKRIFMIVSRPIDQPVVAEIDKTILFERVYVFGYNVVHQSISKTNFSQTRGASSKKIELFL